MGIEHIQLSVMCMGFAVLFVFMRMMWTSLNSRLDRIEDRIIKLEEKFSDLDKRVYRIEGSIISKECCILNQKENKEAK